MSGPRGAANAALTRREFVRVAGMAGGGLLVAIYLPGCRAERRGDPPGRATLQGGDAPPTDAAAVFEPNAWVRIHPDNSATITVANSEMGQGVRTSLALLVAEEMDLDWTRVRIAQAPNDAQRYGDQGTGGSASVKTAWEPLRTAGAAARHILVTAAATALGVPAGQLETRDSRVRHARSNREMTYAALAPAAVGIAAPSTVKPKPRSAWRLLGRDGIVGVDVADITTGRAQYGSDVRVPGMLYAVVERTPVHGGRVRHYDASAALAVPGVRKVVEVPGVGGNTNVHPGVAVLADNTWAALQGRKALTIEWDAGPHGGDTTERMSAAMHDAVSRKGSVTVYRAGDPHGVLAATPNVVDASYECPFLSHATMEPQTCFAEVREGHVTLRSPTQFPDWAASAVAAALHVSKENVQVTIPLLGGGYGRRINPDFSVEAALIARAAGAPVKVVWTREDDMRHDFYRPCAVHRFEAAVGSDGYPVAWRHRFSTPAIRATLGPGSEQAWASDEGDGSANMLYRVANRAHEYTHLPAGVTRGWWRAVSTTHGTFALESFIDELAERAGIDPIEYRLHLIDALPPDQAPADSAFPPEPERLKGVLRRVAQASGWGRPLARGHAMGVACGIDHLGYAAEVIEVSMRGKAVRVERVVCAVDCGPVVNPDGGRAQVEGAIHQGLSAALGERITVRDGAVAEGNFDQYSMLRIDRAPRRVEVYFVETDTHPTGLGEPALPPAAPALANAIYRLTGTRVRRLPVDG